MPLYVADYSFSRPDPRALKAAGYSGVMRYLCPVFPSTRNKIIAKPEYDALIGNGLQVTLNFEWSETRPFAGFAAGAQDAATAEAQADALGYPLSAPIYYSVDTAANVDQVRPYFQGIKGASKRPVGFYGGQAVGLQLMREGLISHLWVSNAASWSGFRSWKAMRAAVAPEAHIIQYIDHPFGFQGAIDHNEVLRADFAGASRPITTSSTTPGDDFMGYSDWHPLEKIAFMLDIRHTVQELMGPGTGFFDKTWNTGLTDVSKAVLNNPAAPRSRFDEIADLLRSIADIDKAVVTGAPVDVQPLVDAINRLPEDISQAIGLKLAPS